MILWDFLSALLVGMLFYRTWRQTMRSTHSLAIFAFIVIVPSTAVETMRRGTVAGLTALTKGTNGK